MTAPKVLVVLIRLVGAGVVDKAGDVVEECFERLEDYHGYEVVVEGLVEVLLEVVKVVEKESEADRQEVVPEDNEPWSGRYSSQSVVSEISYWFAHRHDPLAEEAKEDFGPAPRRPWGPLQQEREAAQQEDQNQEEPHGHDHDNNQHGRDANEPKLSSTQSLIHQILSRSLYFLTHPSPKIRAHILTLLASSVSTLSSIESALLPTIHRAWPFIINRLSDSQPFVVVAAAELIQKLAEHVGGFVITKIWEEVWPLFCVMLDKLQLADSKSALARPSRMGLGVGTHTVYATSHRLYAAMLRMLTQAIESVVLRDKVVWEVLLKCRRFLSNDTNDDMQGIARKLYITMAKKNGDAVWLVLGGGEAGPKYLALPNIKDNAALVLEHC